MKLEIRQRDRRALIMLTVALVIYGLADWVVLPAYDRIASGQELALDKEHQLRRYRRAEQRKGQYADLLKLTNESVAKNESIVIQAANVSVASAELQSLIEAAGSKVGLVIGQRMIGAARRVNDYYAEVPMTMTFESTPLQLVSFLDELRLMPRFVTVRTMQVNPVSPVVEAPKGADLTKNVRVNITVAALTSGDLVKPEAGRR
jgi:Tfp pilus assembly protein PilO